METRAKMQTKFNSSKIRRSTYNSYMSFKQIKVIADLFNKAL